MHTTVDPLRGTLDQFLSNESLPALRVRSTTFGLRKPKGGPSFIKGTPAAARAKSVMLKNENTGAAPRKKILTSGSFKFKLDKETKYLAKEQVSTPSPSVKMKPAPRQSGSLSVSTRPASVKHKHKINRSKTSKRLVGSTDNKHNRSSSQLFNVKSNTINHLDLNDYRIPNCVVEPDESLESTNVKPTRVEDYTALSQEIAPEALAVVSCKRRERGNQRDEDSSDTARTTDSTQSEKSRAKKRAIETVMKSIDWCDETIQENVKTTITETFRVFDQAQSSKSVMKATRDKERSQEGELYWGPYAKTNAYKIFKVISTANEANSLYELGAKYAEENGNVHFPKSTEILCLSSALELVASTKVTKRNSRAGITRQPTLSTAQMRASRRSTQVKNNFEVKLSNDQENRTSSKLPIVSTTTPTQPKDDDIESHTARRPYLRQREHQKLIPLMSMLMRNSSDKSTLFNLSFHGITDKECPSIAQVLLVQRGLTNLDLRGNRFTHEGLALLVKSLSDQNELVEIRLTDNPSLGTSGAKFIAKLIRGRKSLKRLELSNCALFDRGVSMLNRLLGNRQCLIEYLDLSSNRIGKGGATQVAHMLRSFVKLKRIDLSWNFISGESANDILDTLSRMKNLTHINLAHNALKEEAGLLTSVMRKSKATLEVLDVSYNSISHETQRALKRSRRISTAASVLRVNLTGNIPRTVTLPAPRSMVGVYAKPTKQAVQQTVAFSKLAKLVSNVITVRANSVGSKDIVPELSFSSELPRVNQSQQRSMSESFFLSPQQKERMISGLGGGV